jgi:hypothetical protein
LLEIEKENKDDKTKERKGKNGKRKEQARRICGKT